MNTLHTPHPLPASVDRQHRQLPKGRQRHRWMVATLAVVTGLLVYAAGLGWFANRLADDLSATIQPIPALEDQQHAAN